MNPEAKSSDLASAFLACVEHPQPHALDRTELEKQLRAILASACAAWPDLDLDEVSFVEHLGSLSPEDFATWLGQLRADDAYLAFGCARGDAASLEVFERVHAAEMRVLAMRLLPEATAQEVVQKLRQQLLVATETRPPGIAKYAGQGRLRAWLRVTTVRESVRARKKAGLEMPAEEQALQAVGTEGGDPELRYMRALYKAQFREAFSDALAALTPRERTLLRYTVIDGLTVDRVGAIYRVHRATAARWVAKARERLVVETRRALMQRLAVGAPEQESILRLIRSDLDLSIRSFLREEVS